jgi:hypothetical protein
VNPSGASRKAATIGLGALLAIASLAASNACLVFDGLNARSRDVGDAALTDAGAFCASLPKAAAFCSELADRNFGDWSTAFDVGGGTHAIDDREYLSPPSAFLSSTPALTSNAANAFLSKQLLGAATRKNIVELRFSVRFESTAPPSPVTFGRLTLSRGSDAYVVFLNRNESQLWALEGPAATDLGASIAAPSNDTWIDYAIRIEREATYVVTVTQGTTTLVSRKPTTTSAGERDDVIVELGILYASGPATAQHVRYDNVALFTE